MNLRTALSACCMSFQVALSIPLSGCMCVNTSGCSSMATMQSSRSMRVSHQAKQGLEVTGDNGEVVVTQSWGDQVVIDVVVKAQTQERADAVQVIAERGPAGELHVYALWPDNQRRNNEGCSFAISIPDASTLKATTGNGLVSVTGLSGEADLRTSNGRIIAQNFSGNVHAHSSNGAIELTNVLGADADTSNGRIDVALRDGAGGPVDLKSSNGGITLRVASSFVGEVECKTSNGGVHCDVAGAQTVTQNRSSATYRLGSGGATSTIRTSNGGIQISKAAN